MIDGDYTVVPVVADFGSREPIGELRILTQRLPAHPAFCFALGYTAQALENRRRHVPQTAYLGSYELIEVAIVMDTAYNEYLKQIGVNT